MARGTADRHDVGGGRVVTRTPVRRLQRATVVAAVALLLSACAEPELADTEPEQGAEDPLEASEPDPLRADLIEQLERLHAAVADTRAALAPALDDADGATIQAAAAEAFDLLVGEDVDGTVFPATEGEREREGRGDAELSATLSLAREAGGDLGRSVVEVLRDPVAGDVGTWERDPEGMVDIAVAAVAGADDLDAAIGSVAEVPGDGTRAIAWTALARDTTDAELGAAAAERADAHLGVVEVAIELLLEDPDADPEADDPGADDPDELPDELEEIPEELDETEDLGS
jgi:hypothetical protein